MVFVTLINKKYLSYIRENSDIYLLNLESREDSAFIRDQPFLDLPYQVDYTWSPDSQWVAFVGWGKQYFSNVFVQHIEEDSPRQITFLSNNNCRSLLWSPDGKYIVFSTGHSQHESRIARVDLQPVLPIFKEDEFDKLFQAAEKDKNSSETPEDDNAENGEDTSEDTSENSSAEDNENVENSEEDSPEANAKSDKEKITIVFDSIKDRLQFLTGHDSYAFPLAIRPNSEILIYAADILGDDYLWSMSMDFSQKRRQPNRLYHLERYAADVFFSRDGKKILYNDSGYLYSMILNDSGDRKSGPTLTRTRAEVKADFHQRKIQIFNEAWTLINDHFYDATFHGCNWEKVYETFAPLVRDSQTDESFRELLRIMLGELNASHLGVSGWRHSGTEDGYLGVWFDPKELLENGNFKITHVLKNAPVTLVESPARVGEYLVAIENTTLDGKTINLAVLLERKVKRRVKLLLNDTPTLKNAREIVVQPINDRKHEKLQYLDWVNRNAEFVVARSKGKIGYVHIPGMYYKDYMKFLVDLDTETHNREGIIIDVRYNGGGYISASILDVLYRKSFTQYTLRNRGYSGGTSFDGNRILEKPLILITNQQSASDAEVFSEGFRRLGLGKIIGKPTAGAVIATDSWRFLDGTRFRLPRFLVRTMDGENTELSPRPVDISVERGLGETASGKDSQLDVAVETLLKALKKERRRKR